MKRSEKMQIVDMISEQISQLRDDYAVLAQYGCNERKAVAQAIKHLQNTQRQIVEIFMGDENNE